jgi:hypothetical protein
LLYPPAQLAATAARQPAAHIALTAARILSLDLMRQMEAGGTTEPGCSNMSIRGVLGQRLALGLVPLYALLLQWVYRSRRRRYGAHLVFGLYAHSFLLLIFVIEAKLPLALATILSMWAFVYYALSLKRVYGGTWSETIGRGALLTILYFLASLAIGLLVTVLVLSM